MDCAALGVGDEFRVLMKEIKVDYSRAVANFVQMDAHQFRYLLVDRPLVDRPYTIKTDKC